MGGYGFYVWGSYGVTLVLLTAEVITLRARKRRVTQSAVIDQKPETRNSKLETA